MANCLICRGDAKITDDLNQVLRDAEGKKPSQFVVECRVGCPPYKYDSEAEAYILGLSDQKRDLMFTLLLSFVSKGGPKRELLTGKVVQEIQSKAINEVDKTKFH